LGEDSFEECFGWMGRLRRLNFFDVEEWREGAIKFEWFENLE
jgi:hypothetical protein